MELTLTLTMLPLVERKLVLLSNVVGVQCVPNLYCMSGEHPTASDFAGQEVPALSLGVEGEECTHSMADLRAHWDHAPHWRTDLQSNHVRCLGALLPYCETLTSAVVKHLGPKDAVVSVLGGRIPVTTTFTTGLDQLAEIAYVSGVIAFDTGNTVVVSIRLLDEAASPSLTYRPWTELPEVLELAEQRRDSLIEELRSRSR